MQFIMGYGWHFYYDGNDFAGGLWTTSGSPKSIYDPCPAGWRVPDGGPDGVFAKASGETYKALVEVIARRGVDLSGKFGDDSCIWYPFAGFRDPYDGGFDLVGCQGFFWTATLGSDPDAAYVVSFSGSDTGVVWLGVLLKESDSIKQSMKNSTIKNGTNNVISVIYSVLEEKK